MIFNKSFNIVLGAFCGVLLCNTPVKAEQRNHCKQVIYSGKIKTTNDDILICVISDNTLFASYTGADGLTEIAFDKETASWTKVIEDSAVVDNAYRIINTTFVMQGVESLFVLESSAVGLENNTTDATFKINIPGSKEEVLEIEPSTVMNNINVRLEREHAIPGEIYFKKEKIQ